jgi:hypothetical protein
MIRGLIVFFLIVEPRAGPSFGPSAEKLRLWPFRIDGVIILLGVHWRRFEMKENCNAGRVRRHRGFGSTAAAQAKEQFFPVCPTARAYAPNGIPFANGYVDSPSCQCARRNQRRQGHV